MFVETKQTARRLNVFKGDDALADYYNPDLNPPLPMVEIPAKLNPFRHDGVRIYAKMLTALPAQNVKALPALNMLLHEPSARDQSIVEASSGSTVLSMGMVSRVLWANEDVTAYVTNKKHVDQLRLLRFFGLKISLYGGLAQQEPTDPRGIMARLRRLANGDPNTCYPGQYDNANNWKAHERWTGPQILAQIPEINVFCTTVGTGGCITGTGVYLKSQKPLVKVVGIFNALGDPTPGPRHIPGFSTCGFPWKNTVDELEEVASVESYRMSMKLSREGLICGPSSGEALHGLLKYLSNMKSENRFGELVDPMTGEISCVFTCSDLPYQYMDGYFQRLREEEFPVIENQILSSCDQDPYDERWELPAKDATTLITALSHTSPQLFETMSDDAKVESRKTEETTHKSSATRTPNDILKIIDLRSAKDFASSHFNASLSLPLPGLASDTGDLFGSSQLLQKFWTSMRQLFDDNAFLISPSTAFLVLCYDGEASRLATSVLRARSIEAYSAQGGYPLMRQEFISIAADIPSYLDLPSREPNEKSVPIDTITAIELGCESPLLGMER